MTVDNLQPSLEIPDERLDAFFRLSEGSVEEQSQPVDGRDWTAMHFKKRTEKPGGSKAKSKRKMVRNQDLAVLKSQEPTVHRGARDEKEQKKIDITIQKIKTMESMDLVQKVGDHVDVAETNNGKQ